MSDRRAFGLILDDDGDPPPLAAGLTFGSGPLPEGMPGLLGWLPRDPGAAERKRRQRQRCREDRRTLHGSLALEETAVSVLTLRRLLPRTETDAELLEGVAALLDKLAESGCEYERHAVTGGRPTRATIRVELIEDEDEDDE